ncbi:MAG: GDP-mannose 4,6-dehydratase [Deltaproteobacteria bacterium]|nr:GDP-mannose 4,6-dehydratase [Deltaproteobacteria bacterium]
MTTLLVTGCAGFIGSNFCRLFENEFKIIGVDCMGRGSHPANIPERITFHDLDISRASTVSGLMDSLPHLDGIINFAAESHVDFSLQDDAKFWKTNVEGLRCLARWAIRKKIRLLQVSTDEVYGSSLKGEWFTEKSPLNPRNPYAASKAAGDLLVLSYSHSNGLDGVITRGCNTMGPRQFPDKVVPKAVTCFLKDESFPLYRTSAKRLWLDVESHCRAVKLLFEKGKSGEVYNIASGQDHEIETRALVETIRNIVGKGTIREVDDRAGYDLRYLISAEKIQNEFGWSPRKKLPQLIEQTVLWYHDHPEWIRECKV